MADAPTEKKREVEKHYLPEDYNGRCQGTEGEDYFSSFITFGGKLAKDEVLHKFEMRLPLPTVDDETFNDEALSLFNLSAIDMVKRAIAKLATDVDDSFKKTLFQGIDAPTDASLGEVNHNAAQIKIDDWRYSPQTGKGKTVKVADVVARLKAQGKLPADAEISTNEELFAYLNENL